MKKYFLHDGVNQYGPFDLAELESKIITPQTMVWNDSLPDWKPAVEIEELKPFLNSKIPASQILTPPTMTTKNEDWTKKMYYYTDSNGQQGPFTFEQLKSRSIRANTAVWCDPMPEWTTADKIPGLIDIGKNVEASNVSGPGLQKRMYYYLDTANQKQGPFELHQLKGKPVYEATYVWYEHLTEWTTAGKVPELKDVINQSSAPLFTHSSPQKKSYYFIDASGKQQGPFEPEQLKGRGITADTLIWHDQLTEWKKAGTEESLNDIISGTSGGFDWSKTLFYYTDASGQQGPFTLEQMKTKHITAATPVWYSPLPNWTTAGQVEGLRGIIR